MVTYILYCAGLWFWFYLLNHTDLFVDLMEWADANFGLISGALRCAFCFGWWISLLIAPSSPSPLAYLFAAPVGVLFIDLAYRRLK